MRATEVWLTVHSTVRLRPLVSCELQPQLLERLHSHHRSRTFQRISRRPDFGAVLVDADIILSCPGPSPFSVRGIPGASARFSKEPPKACQINRRRLLVPLLSLATLCFTDYSRVWFASLPHQVDEDEDNESDVTISDNTFLAIIFVSFVVVALFNRLFQKLQVSRFI